MACEAVVGIQGTRQAQITNSTLNTAGRDNHINTHLHYYGASVQLKSVLHELDNFRKIQQETLEKATVGTIDWLFETQDFSLWWNKNPSFTIWWGSGMREFLDWRHRHRLTVAISGRWKDDSYVSVNILFQGRTLTCSPEQIHCHQRD
jgi:hypothetical protein